MSKYTVVWTKSARDELADIWMEAADREAVTSASNAVGRLLGNDPDRKGAELPEGLRVLVVRPLRVLFSVRKADRIADVEKVAWMHRGRLGQK